MTNGGNEAASGRKVIHATCSVHGGPTGFTNVVLRKVDGEIELDPHATGACVIRLGEDAGAAVRDQLGEWLGR